MINYDDQFSSERGKGNRSRETRESISTYISNEIESQKYRKVNEEKMVEKERLFGRNSERISMIRQIGIDDRMNAIPYDSDKYDDEHDKNNYYEGFFAMGNRALHGRLETLSDEQLQKIGANDYISGVDLNELPEAVKNNTSYIQGNIMASIMGESKGKGRR